ncbi:MAG: hypothetical protein E7399_03075 [Ruminococcaceae bacterium]|nr:hypothetical protein [Oscillospiraceae bacterium]
MARYYAKLDIAGEFEANFSLPLFTGDSGNSVLLEFYNHGKPYDMSGAMIYAKRTDGTVLATSAVTEGNKAEFVLYNNMYAYPGELQVQVTIVDVYGDFLTSGILYFTVQAGFSEQSEGEGSNDFCELTSLIRQVGEGIGSIQRAEAAAETVESLFQQMPQLEHQVIALITENQLDDFSSGFAIVSASETVDSEDGPIVSEFRYPLVAESEDIFGSLTVIQTRFYQGRVEQRQVGGKWKTPFLSYRGSLNSTGNLPEFPVMGDIYNIETESAIAVKGEAKKIRLIPVSGGVYEAKDFQGTYDSSYDYWWAERDTVELFDRQGNSLGIASVYTLKDGYLGTYPTDFLEPGMEVAYAQVPGTQDGDIAPGDEVTVYEAVQIPVMPRQKVFYNGNEWDVLAGNLSTFATKEEVGNIEAALDEVLALQNAFIQEGV